MAGGVGRGQTVNDELWRKHRDLWDNRPPGGYDCGEIAEDFEAIGGNGRIVKISHVSDTTLVVSEYGEVVEHQYHEVYVEDGFVYDPRFAADPTPEGEYFHLLRSLNNGDINISG